MSVAALQIQSILRMTDRGIKSDREPKQDVRNPSSSAPADEVAISLEAKRLHIIDQIVGRVVREITDQAVSHAPGTGEAPGQEFAVI